MHTVHMYKNTLSNVCSQHVNFIRESVTAKLELRSSDVKGNVKGNARHCCFPKFQQTKARDNGPPLS